MADFDNHFADSVYDADIYGGYSPAMGENEYADLMSFSEDRPTPRPSLMEPVSRKSSASRLGDIATAGGMASGNPYLATGGLLLKGAGTVADIYGKYKERDEAKKRYEDTLRAWEISEADRKVKEARERDRRDRQEDYFAADYSQDLMSNLAGAYGGFRTPGAM